MSLHFYNSISNKVEEFKPNKDKEVSIYVCGPTVYNYIHIGNARPVVFYDIVRRYLSFCGYDVKFASNITDIDDKIIKKAKESNKTEKEISTFYEEAYFTDVKRLNSLMPDYIPHATSYIEDMISFISDLIDKGYAYQIDGNVYFRINKIDDYGVLSNQAKEALVEGARIEVDKAKESPLDFTLWKKTDEGIKWPSPFGEGRPGWHTECVVMNHKLFGSLIDIHGGGMDLKFPHHENEIAQCEAMYNTHLANYFLHVGRVDLKGVKMSKSLGNYIFVKDFKTEREIMVLRLILAFSPYRANINYQDDLFSQFANIYDKWQRAYKQVYYFLASNDLLVDDYDEEIINKFKMYMDDDFNVQNVLSLFEDLIKQINLAYRQNKVDLLGILFNTFKIMSDIFGINYYLNPLTDEAKSVYLAWQAARNNKDFDNADNYRKKLIELGII